jgi:N6-L-threonylcarbamoyladenine synthase
MFILGIETSCDDTGISIIKATPTKIGVKFDILSNVISSQIKTHAPFGGVVPNLAAREHLKNIEPCLKTALNEADTKMEQVDLIAITVGPGLIPSLLIGVHFAKALAYKYKKPIIAVNHIEAHVVATFNDKFSRVAGSRFAGPAIALVVSGGHTQLVLVKKIGDYKIIGETRDDAAGECFDKVAKLLNLGYPGGPIISAMAEKFKIQNSKFKIHLPRPMINHKNYDFSFSGLKTAVLYLTRNQKSKIKNKKFIQELCHETQQAIIDVLIDKTLRAAKEYKAKTIILSGGVAANTELRKQFEFKIQNLPAGRQGSKFEIQFLVPTKNLCTDNGAMIAMAGYYNAANGIPLRGIKNYNKIIADANLRLS